MKPFVLTNAAKADLKVIARFTEKRWGRKQRNIYMKHFDDAFHLLANTPSMGKTCDFIKSGYQKFSHASHIIFTERALKVLLRLSEFFTRIWILFQNFHDAQRRR